MTTSWINPSIVEEEEREIPDDDWPLAAGNKAEAQLGVSGELDVSRLRLRFIAPILARIFVRRSLVQMTNKTNRRRKKCISLKGSSIILAILDKVRFPVTVDGRLPSVRQWDPSVVLDAAGGATCGAAIPVVDGRKPRRSLIDVTAEREDERKNENDAGKSLGTTTTGKGIYFILSSLFMHTTAS